MSQLHKNVRNHRRISALLFSLLRRVSGWLDSWIKRRRTQWATRREQPTGQSTLHFEALEPRLLLSADLAAGSLTYSAHNPLLPGDNVSALFEVHRPDNEVLSNPVRIAFYASTDASLDAADTLVGQVDVAADQLPQGSHPINVALDLGQLTEPGQYRLIGVIDADNSIAESNETNNQSLAAAPLDVQFAVGQLPGRSPVSILDLSDADGTRFTLSIVGPGVARFDAGTNGYHLTLSDTDASTRVELAGSGGDGRIVLSGITAANPLGSLIAPVASLKGVATFNTIGSLSLAEIAAGARLEASSLASVTVTSDALGDLRLSGSGATGFVLGSAQVGGAIGGLWSIAGRANSISAQSTRAAWRANVSAPLTQLAIRGDASGQFAASALQILQVGGSLRGMTLRIGANLGSDGVLGGSGSAADSFGPGTLARMRVSGDVSDSLIVIGLDPHNDSYFDGDDQQLGSPSNRVQELLVGGQLTGHTRIVAPAFPTSVRINGAVVSPGSLSQLASTPPDLIAPTLVAGLLDDSGESASDGLTRDPSIAGQASDAGGLARLLAALDPGATPTLVDLSSALQADGSFVLTAALLDGLAGGTLADGSHSVRLIAEDSAGNASAAADVAFTLDRSAPLLSLELDPAFDTGPLGDRQTTATPVDLLVGSEAGARVELLDSLGQTLADSVADAAGNVRFAGLALLLGENRFSARATDSAGNSRLADLTLTRTAADTTAPIVTLQLANDSGASANDGVTNDATISGTVSDASPIASLRAGFGSDPAGFTSILAALQNDGNFALDAVRLTTLNGGALADGEHTLRVIASDSAGNASAISELAFTLDTVAPAAPAIDLTDSSDSGVSSSDNLTNDTTPTLSITGEGGSTLRLFEDGTLIATLAGRGGDVTVDSLADGEHTFNATAEDLAGNLSAAGTLQITIDTVPPDAPLLDLATASDSGVSATDKITNDTTPMLMITAEPDSELSLFRDGALVAEGLLGPVAAFTSDALIDGRYHFTASASDAAGNVGPAGDLQITIDTVAPAVSVQLANDSGVSASDGITSDPTMTGIVDETGVLASLHAGFGNDPTGFTSIIDALQADGSFTLGAARLATINGGALADGDHSLRLLASDLAGNTSALSELAFTLDTTAPALVSFGLDPASDTGVLGDLETSASVATLLGLSEAGVGVSLNGNSTQTTANASGAFSFVDQPLALGDNAFTIVLSDAAGNITQSTLTVTRVEPTIEDHTAPTLAAGLLIDSGRGNSDGITNDPTIAGVATDDTAVTVLQAGFGSDPATFVDVLDSVQVDGSFTLDAAQLALINGGALPDGSYTLGLRAEDAVGNIATSSVTFVLDTQAPAAPSFGLSIASDTGVVGDGDTEAARVTLIGSAEANANLTLLETGVSGVASNKGSFFLPDVALALGDNTLTLRAIDAAGNAAQTSLVLHRSATQSSGDAVLQWNDIALAAIQLDASTPPVATRGLAMLSITVLDTVSAFEGTPGYYVSRTAPAGASLDAAIAATAERMLAYLYPAQQANFATVLAATLAGIADGPAKTDAVALGRSIADDVIALRRGDGFDDFVDFNAGTLPGQWQATAPMYAPALLPQWATLQPFAMSSPSEFRPAPPPALDSATYTADFNDVKALGSATGSTRSAEQTATALFWADGAGTDTPPGHWNRIAATLASTSGNSLAANARLFAELNVALADATITAWDAKYTYQAWRPITAIHAADADGNDATTADAQWTSLLINPPFPEYVSGHSTYSGAAEAILSGAFGANTAFTINSEGLPGVQRSYASVHDAAEEAGRSRIYGGIHFEYGNQAGLSAGRALGQQVLDVFAAGTDTQAPRLLLDQADGLVTATNLSFSGRVLDALSGVATLEASLDAANPAPIAFDAEGRFTLPTAFALDGSADGVHTLTLTATDARGNASAPFTLGFTLDTQAPVITLASIADGDSLSADSRLTGTADPSGSTLISLTYAFDGGQKIPLSFDAATGQFDTAFDLARLGIGAHGLTVEATDAAGNSTASTLNLTLPELIPLTITRATPSSGADDVGATFRPQVFFSRPVDVATLDSSNFYATDTTGARLAATIVPALDGSFAWLFLKDPMPGASTITIHVVGDSIRAAVGGQALDADGDGTAGGSFVYRFTTVSVTPIAGTTITGRLLDPGDDLKPMTLDDIRSGADGVLHTADDVFLNPIAGAKIYILGLEGNVLYTDADGYFHLDQVPAGDVKLAIDGRTATNAPAGAFYPEMVLDLTIEVGYDNTVMGSMGTREAMVANEERQEVYLPRLQTSILQTVGGSTTTELRVDAASAPNLTDEQRAQLKLEVQAGTLIDADGNVMTSGQVGISTVPPELVRDMLPPGVLQHTFDITIQAPGVAAFATPLEITFPNVFNAAPGTKLNFLSFDHTTGRLEIEGTATVSADGKSVTTDPGNGITKPGWHGLTPPGFVLTIYNGYPCVDPTQRLQNLLSAVPKAFGAVFSVAADGLSVTSGLVTSRALSIASSIASWATTLASHDFGVNSGTGSALTGTYSAVARDGAAGRQLASNASAVLAVLDTQDQIEEVQRLIKDARDLVPCENVVGEDPATIADRASAAADAVLAKAQSQAPLFAQLQASAEDLYRLAGQANPQLQQFGYSPSEQSQLLASMNSYVAVANQILEEGPFFVSLVQFFNSVSTFLTEFASCDTYYSTSGGGGGGGGSSGGTAPASTVYPKYYWSAEVGNTVIRGSEPLNLPIRFFAPPDELIRLTAFEPTTARLGTLILTTGASGQSVEICGLPMVKIDGLPDEDADGLSDLAEIALGTSSAKRDTDSDGMSDLAEITAGLDPLGGRALPTGIIATLPLQGQAKAVTLEGSTTSAETQTAYVATGSYGLAIVDASRFQRPLVLGQIDLSGDAVDVAVDSRLGIAAVAAGSALHLVDVSDATAPVRTQTINIPAVQVEAANGVAYVAAGNGIESYSLLTGELLQVLPIGSSAIVSLARDGSMLYAVDAASTLRAIDISGLAMRARGELALPAAGGRIFVGNGIAYIGASSGVIGGFTAGFTTADVGDPDAMHVLSGPDMFNLQGYAVTANGSGLGLLAGTLIGASGALSRIDVVDVRDPTRTDQFLTSFNLSAPPFDVAIGAGIAFVADGTGGLQVANYLPFDNKGRAPTITLSAPTADLDAGTPGIQALEGSLINVKLDVNDDQQVRNVELLVDGRVVANDVSFPWSAAVALPTLAAATTATIQASATDTGGNTTLSDALVIELVPDTFAPTIVTSNVKDGSRHAQTFRTVRLSFDEALDVIGITAEHFRLLDVSDNVILPTDVALSANGQLVTLTLPTLAQGSYRLVIDGDQVSDRAGNPFGSAGQIVSTFDIVEATIEWAAPAGGDWNNAANWDLGRIPDATDVVLINGGLGTTVNINAGNVRVQGIDSFSDLTLNGASLTVDSFLTVHDAYDLTLNDGVIQRGTITLEGSANLMVASGTRNSRLDGVTVVGDIDLVNATLRLKDVAIDGRVSLSNGGYSGYSTLAFEGTQTLAGNAEIVSNFDGYYNSNYLEMQAAGELTLGADVRVHGSSLVLGGSLAFNASMERLINQGTIEAATGSVQVVADAFTNEGVAEATGGTLYLSAADNAQTTSGRLRVTSGELYTSGDWALPGVIETSGGALYLGGTLHTGGFAGFVSTGGVVNFTGTVENSGSTLTLGAMPGDWVLNGTIHGGTLQIDAGESLMVASGTRNSRLDGVTVVGDIDLVNATLRLKDVAIDGRVSLSNGGYSGYSTLAFEGTQTLAGNAEIVSNFDGYYNSNYLEMQAAGELTLGADVRVHGSSLVLGGSLAFNASMERLINQGTIEAATGSVQVVADAFTNEGVAEATGGTLYLSAADNAQTTSGRLRVTSGELYTSGDWALPGVIETSGGALYLGGTLHTGGFAGFVSTGGVVNFTGTVENSGSTLTLGAMPGDWVLNGTIHGGTLQIDAGESLMVASGTRNSRLDGVTVVGDIDLVNATLRLKDMAIDGRVSLSNGGYSGYSTLAFEGTQTLAGNAEIVSNFDGYYNSNYLEMQAAGELTLGADVRVHGSSLVLGGSLAFNASMERLINQGTIEAATGSVQVVADAFTNEGVAEATGGTLYLSAADNAQTTSGRLRVTSGELYTSGDWALPGVIETSGGALYLGGTLHTGGFAGFVSTGGVVNFTGTVENSGSTLTLGAMPGDWVLNGTIHGGTLQIDAGESLMVASGTRNSRLDGVTVVGDIDLVNATLRLKDVAIDGRVSLSNGGYSGYSTLAFEGTQTLAGNAEIVSNFDGYYNSNYLEMQAAGELTLGADVRVHGSSLVLGGSLAFNASMERLINQGTIEAATGSVQVVADAFTNEGVAEATGGTLYLSAADNAQTTSGRLRVTSGELYTSGDWALPGVIETSGGALYLGGTLHTGGFAGFVSTGGVVNFTGTVENSGSTLTLGAMPGDWVLNGTIHGGTLQIDAGESLMVASGTRNSRLDGVTVVGDIDLVNATLRLKDMAIDGRVSLSNGGYSGYSTLAFEGTQTLAGNAEIVSNFDGYYNSNYLEMQAAGELTLGADVRVHGSSLVLGGSLAFNASMERLINQGTIEAATGSVQVVADAFTNEGVAEATGGTLYLSAADNAQTTSGRLRVTSGELYTSGDWALPGVIETSGGALYLGGTLHTGGFAGFVSTGGVVNFTGTVENSGSTLTLGAMPGDWVLNGTIHGGTLQIDAGESLMVASGTRNSRLDGVTVVGDIDLVNATLRLKDVAIDGRVSLSNGGYSGYSTLAFEGTQTLAGNAEIVSNFDGYYNSNYLEMQAAGELTLGADVRVHGSSLVLGGSLAFNASMERLINQGTIEAATGSVQVVADAFTNEGVAEATGGTLYLSAADNAQTTSGRLRVTSGELYTSGDWALPGVIETSGGALYLGGTLHTGGFAGFVSTGGVVNFTGTVENSGSTLTLGAMPGDWVLNGTIHGGTLQIDAGESLMVASGTRNSRLDGVTVVGDIDLVNATLRLKDVAIDGRVSLSNGGYSGYSTLAFEGTQTLAGNAEIVSNFDGYYNSNYLEMQAAGELTLGADVRVHGSSLVLGGSLAFNASMERLINQGTIEAATGSVQVVADAFTNEGVAEATGGTLYLSAADNAQTTSGRLRVTSGELYTSGDWALPGVIETSGGALYLGGTLHTGGFAGFVSTGGVVNFTGTVENSGSTLTLGAMPGDWVLNGTIHGGTLQIDAGESLMVASGTRNSRLDGVTVVGDIDLVNATLRLKDMAIDGRVSLSNGGYSGYSTLAFEGTQTLAGNAEIVSNFDGYYNSNYLEMQAAGELTLGADVRVHGSSLVLGGSLAFNASMERLINQGTIEAATGSVQVVADAFTNEGVAEATGGTLYLSAADNAQTTSGRLRVTSGELYTSGDWALPGVIETSGGALYLGGTLHTGGFAGFVSTGGVVNFTGTVENSGSTLTLGAMPGDWVLNGTIHGGTLQIDAGESLMVASGTRNSRLDGVTVVGDIDLVNATLRLKDVAIDGRVSLSNGGYSGYSTLAFEGTQTLAGNAEIVSNFDGYYNSNYLEMQAAGELTLGADVRVHGSSLVLGGSLAFNASMERLINQGTIEAATGSVQVVADAFTNEGVAEATGGTLNVGGTSFTNTGSVEAAGGNVTISSTTVNNAAAMHVAEGAVIQLSGTVTMASTSLVEVVLGGTLASEFGRFSSSGSLVLDGMVRVSLSGGFVPSLGDEFAFLTYNARTGQFVGVDDADGTPGVGYNLTYGPIDAAITAVPG